MHILLYSEKCENCHKILALLDKSSFNNLFKIININNTQLDLSKFKNLELPIIIDKKLAKPINGKNVNDYINNLKYFNNPTNNMIYNNNNSILIPNIKEDDKAISNNINYLNL
jgi:hypothetical protein